MENPNLNVIDLLRCSGAESAFFGSPTPSSISKAHYQHWKELISNINSAEGGGKQLSHILKDGLFLEKFGLLFQSFGF